LFTPEAGKIWLWPAIDSESAGEDRVVVVETQNLGTTNKRGPCVPRRSRCRKRIHLLGITGPGEHRW